MAETMQAQASRLIDRYPWRIILFRWLLVASEMGLATYLVLALKFELAVAFIVYGVIAVFFLLPAIRCSRCYYYGKRCNFGWGEWVSKIYPHDSDSSFSSLHGYWILIWPLKIIPIATGLWFLPSLVSKKPAFLLLSLFGAYLLVLFIHRSFYRSKACTRCHQNDKCPIYDKSVMLALFEKSETV